MRGKQSKKRRTGISKKGSYFRRGKVETSKYYLTVAIFLSITEATWVRFLQSGVPFRYMRMQFPSSPGSPDGWIGIAVQYDWGAIFWERLVKYLRVVIADI